MVQPDKRAEHPGIVGKAMGLCTKDLRNAPDAVTPLIERRLIGEMTGKAEETSVTGHLDEPLDSIVHSTRRRTDALAVRGQIANHRPTGDLLRSSVSTPRYPRTPGVIEVVRASGDVVLEKPRRRKGDRLPGVSFDDDGEIIGMRPGIDYVLPDQTTAEERNIDSPRQASGQDAIAIADPPDEVLQDPQEVDWYTVCKEQSAAVVGEFAMFKADQPGFDGSIPMQEIFDYARTKADQE